MKISIITPYLGSDVTDQAEGFLADCRASVEAQKPAGNPFTIEHLIMPDDISKPKGVASMRNAACNDACGDFFLFLDSDDYLGEGALSIALDKAEENPGAMVAMNIRKTWYKRDSELKNDVAPDEAKKETDEESEKTGERITDPGSVLGILIPSELMKNCRFDEDLKFYSDLPVMTMLIARAKVVYAPEAVYYQRRHNDAVRYPSLDQIKDEERNAMFERSLRKASVNAAESKEAQRALSGYICRFCLNKMIKGKHPEGLLWKEKDLAHICGALSLCEEEFIRNGYTGARRRILIRLRKGKTKAAQRLSSLYVMNRKKKGLFGSPSQWKWNIYKRIFKKLPVKKELFLFESFLGKSYGDSCRAIYEYMNSGQKKFFAGNKKPVRFVWVIDNKDAVIPGKHKEVKPLCPFRLGDR